MKRRVLWVAAVALVISLAAISLTKNHKPQAPGEVKRASGGDGVPIQAVFAVRQYITDWF